MRPTIVEEYAVKAPCSVCGGVSVFDYKDRSHEFGIVTIGKTHRYEDVDYQMIRYQLLRCSACGNAALAKFHTPASSSDPPVLESFHPPPIGRADLPGAVPEGIRNEYREAELCASVGAYRGASALVRSTLEKTLKASGYTKRSLEANIDDAGADGVITDARRQKAHDDIRVLGNEIVHDEWRTVDEAEVEAALHYAQRILEDLYDDRVGVEQILIAKGRLSRT